MCTLRIYRYIATEIKIVTRKRRFIILPTVLNHEIRTQIQEAASKFISEMSTVSVALKNTRMPKSEELPNERAPADIIRSRLH